MAKKVAKTNAVRTIEQQKVAHEVLEYSFSEGESVDGLSVAKKVGYSPEHVYKTLVATAGTNKYFVFVIPVSEELNLKAAAKIVGEKKIEMIHVKDIQKVTGYIRGGCSPIGMKKGYMTVFHESALACEEISVSAGKIGYQIRLNPELLVEFVRGRIEDVCKD